MARLFEGTAFDRPPRCARCGQLESECRCPAGSAAFVPPQKQTARLAVEFRRGGRTVTVVRGLAAAKNDLPALLTQLKSALGAGGSIQDDLLEIQGDQLGRLGKLLAEIGYQVKGVKS